ncbi:GTP-binding signal recognition particle SRP54, G- domain protein [Desulforamulus reducens MI-1]|uniref:Flagellar biosynthesis protein FlhF n=1 Tax=Desulforamulus reducens (strain ATCC BAA-1160 / DSM 100696 / MI-1) TaxID=349161 RepID=A4J748_DESRM|nr:flagellar biosynthesis protein FlhF [Desulforamulus reducens]ABO50901.1 GTP-binding signal recognition particle SRP54, G- domain protein [Desulforamulus reducens MI-1]
MKIKKYTVNEMQEAIQLIKQDLGSEAVIVSSQRVKGKGWLGWLKKSLEVTAVLDDAPVQPAKTLLTGGVPIEKSLETKPPQSQYLDYRVARSQKMQDPVHAQVQRIKLGETRFQPLLDEVLLQMAEGEVKTQAKLIEPAVNGDQVYQRWLEKLLEMDIQPAVAKTLLDAALLKIKDSEALDMVELVLINQTAELLKAPYKGEKNSRFMTFIGQPGVGKTTTLTKLATKYQLLEKKNVALITLYTYRYGSTDHLKIYGDNLDLPVEVVMTPTELSQAIEKHSNKDYIFIDTVGRSSNNTGQVLELKSFLEVIPSENDIFLVLNASTKDRDLFRTIHDFRITSFNKFIFTKVDETATLGSMLNVVGKTGLPIAYYTDGQSIPDDIKRAHPKKIANLLFRSADRYEDC